MKKLAVVILSSIILSGCTLPQAFNKKPAGITVSSTPPAVVFLNGKNVGNTTYTDENLKPGSYTLRIEPEPVDGVTYPAWETRLDLIANATTVVSRSFAAVEAESSGTILQLVKEPGGKTFISVISDPDTVSLAVDGKPSGFTPATKLDVSPGSHTVNLSSPGFKPQELTVKTSSGYNLIVNAKLAIDQLVLSQPVVSSPSASPFGLAADPTASTSADPFASASPAASVTVTMAKPYVVIRETGTGWLRVRQEPSSAAAELGQADVGEKLKYLGESSETGWYKIEFEQKVGWVSGKYVDLVK